MLRELKRYAEERMKLPPTLYSPAPVRYIIELDSDGRLLTPEPIDTADPANRATRRGVPRLVPQIQRTSGVRALFSLTNLTTSSAMFQRWRARRRVMSRRSSVARRPATQHIWICLVAAMR